MPHPLRLATVVSVSLVLAATACQKDNPAQDPPPEIFTTTLGDTVPAAPPSTVP